MSGGGAFGKRSGPEDGALVSGSRALVREAPQSPSTLQHGRAHTARENAAVHGPRRGLSPDAGQCHITTRTHEEHSGCHPCTQHLKSCHQFRRTISLRRPQALACRHSHGNGHTRWTPTVLHSRGRHGKAATWSRSRGPQCLFLKSQGVGVLSSVKRTGSAAPARAAVVRAAFGARQGMDVAVCQ